MARWLWELYLQYVGRGAVQLLREPAVHVDLRDNGLVETVSPFESVDARIRRLHAKYYTLAHPITSVFASLICVVCDRNLYLNLNETIKLVCTKGVAKNLYDNLASLKWTSIHESKTPELSYRFLCEEVQASTKGIGHQTGR